MKRTPLEPIRTGLRACAVRSARTPFVLTALAVLAALAGCLESDPSSRPARSPVAEGQVAAERVLSLDDADLGGVTGAERLKKTAAGAATDVLRVPGGQAPVSFHASIERAGWYDVAMSNPQATAADGNVEAVIDHADGRSTLALNQALGNSAWRTLGAYRFDPAKPAVIALRAASGSTLLLSGVRLRWLGADRSAPSLDASRLPLGLLGGNYDGQVVVEGAAPPWRFEIVSGALPEGLRLDAASGRIQGVAKAAGSFELQLAVSDAGGQRATTSARLLVTASRIQPGAPAPAEAERLKRAQAAATAPANGTGDLSDLLSTVAALPEGGWSRVNLNLFMDAWPSPDLRTIINGAEGNPAAIIAAWSSFAWDAKRAALVLYGGGHANYRGNDVYLWRAATRRWERAAHTTEMTVAADNFVEPVGGALTAPVSAHTYDNNLYLPLIDRTLTLGGASDAHGEHYRVPTADGSRRVTGPYLFDASKASPDKVGGTSGSHVQRVAPHPEIDGGDMWQNRDNWLSPAPGSTPPYDHEPLTDACTGYAAEGGLDTVYVRTVHRVYRYQVAAAGNPGADRWSRVGMFWSGSGTQSTCAYDPQRKFLLSTSRDVATNPDNVGHFVYWDLSGPDDPYRRETYVTPTDPSGEFSQLIANGQISLRTCALDHDPVRSNFKFWCGDGRVWTLTPPTTLSGSGWTIVKSNPTTAAAPPGGPAAIGTGILGKWKYVPNLDVFMGLVDPYAGDVWVYKPAGWVDPRGTSTVNQPPTVGLTSPAPGSVVAQGSALTLTASAADADGSVAQVVYLSGSTVVAQSGAGPSFAASWTPPAAGTYWLTARATDDRGATSTSAPVEVTVTPPNQPPTVALASPVAGSTMTQGATVTLSVNASDADGSVARVRYFDGATLIGESIAAPTFAVAWTPASGTHTLTAQAIDDRGAATTSAAVTITVLAAANQPPSVALASPVNGASLLQGTTITLAASASDPDGSVERVDYFDGSTLIGSSRTGPSFVVGWTPAAGVHAVSARAVDDRGASTASGIATITVTAPNQPPAVTLASPAGGSSFTLGASVALSASASDPDGSVARVRYYSGSTLIAESTTAPTFVANWTPTVAGSHTLTAQAVDNQGATTGSAAATITVVAPNQAPAVALASPVGGSVFALGTPVALSASASDPDGSVVRVRYYSGSTLVAESTNAPSFAAGWTPSAAGLHLLTAQAVDDRGATSTSSGVTVTVAASSAGPTTVTLQRGSTPTAITRDTKLSRFQPYANFGANTGVQQQGNFYFQLHRFAIFASEGGPVPDGATIRSAKLSLYKASYYSMTFGVHSLLVDWSESQATWLQRLPGVSWSAPGAEGAATDQTAAPVATASAGFLPGWLDFDVTGSVQSMARTPSTNFGWKVRDQGALWNEIWFATSENAAMWRPKLVVTYE